MMVIPYSQPSLVYDDNKSVLVNASMPDSVLKKSNSITFSFVQEWIVIIKCIVVFTIQCVGYVL